MTHRRRSISNPALCTRALLAAAALSCSLGTAAAQDFEETWKEFLDEDKVVRVSKLGRPNPATDLADYAKWLLIYTNNDFCRGEVASAEERLAEIASFDPEVRDTLAGFNARMDDLTVKVAAYYAIDSLWRDFLGGAVVNPAELAGVRGADRTCEKGSAAKYSFMMAYHHLCGGDLDAAREVFEGRVLLLVDRTTLDVESVEGLAPRVASMRAFFNLLPDLDEAWEAYLSTGKSPGFDEELPVYECHPTPKIKELILRGTADPCGDGAAALARIRELQEGQSPEERGTYSLELEDLTALVGSNDDRLADLDRAWEAFLPESKVDPALPFGMDYCEPEPRIRAHILTGYTFPCDLAEESIAAAERIRREERVDLSSVTRRKLRELGEVREAYIANGVALEEAWSLFVANGDTVAIPYTPTEEYCDMIQQVKDYTMQGLTGDCNEVRNILEQIEDFTSRVEFKLGEQLECRVQKLRLRLWECQFAVVDELARLEAAADDAITYEQRLETVMAEYNMSMDDRPDLAISE